MYKPFLCKIGLHWPMKKHEFRFTDRVSGESVCRADCPCGQKWLVANYAIFPIFKVKIENE